MRFNASRPHLKGRVLDFGCGVGELTQFIPSQEYCGVDRDRESLAEAKRLHPEYTFVPDIPSCGKELQFDTIAMLAVIEHISGPETLLMRLKAFLSPEGRIVLTTPHPLADGIHSMGARLGLFSRLANEEHDILLNTTQMTTVAAQAGLVLLTAKRFQLGLNQLFVLGHK